MSPPTSNSQHYAKKRSKYGVVFQQDRLLVMYQGEPYRLIDTKKRFVGRGDNLRTVNLAVIKATGLGSRAKRPIWVDLREVEGHESGSEAAALIMAQRREARAPKRPRAKTTDGEGTK